MAEHPAVRPRAPARVFSVQALALSPRYGTYLAIRGLPETTPCRRTMTAGGWSVRSAGSSGMRRTRCECPLSAPDLVGLPAAPGATCELSENQRR